MSASGPRRFPDPAGAGRRGARTRWGRSAQRWPRVLEPTCGRGHFLAGLLAHASPPREILAIEIQAGALPRPREPSPGHALPGARRGDDHLRETSSTSTCGATWPGASAGRSWSSAIRPWVTNAELGCLASDNLPPQVERQGSRGARRPDRRVELRHRRGRLAQAARELAGGGSRRSRCCARRSVARNVLEFADRPGSPIARCLDPPDRRRHAGSGPRSRPACSGSRWRSPVGAVSHGRFEGVPVFRSWSSSEPAGGDGLRDGAAGRRPRRPIGRSRSPTAPARSPGGRGSSTTPPP